MVDALKVIAAAEDNRKLSDSVNDLVDSFNNMDKPAFVKSLDQVSADLDDIYKRDCQ